jgi:hypothetical protein
MKRLPVSCLEDHRTLLWISTLKLVNEVNVIKKTQNNTKTNVFLREKKQGSFFPWPKSRHRVSLNFSKVTIVKDRLERPDEVGQFKRHQNRFQWT